MLWVVVAFVAGVAVTALLANRKPDLFAKVQKVVVDTADKAGV